MKWIKLADRMPTNKDGLVQLWLPVEGLCAIVIGYDARMDFKDGKDSVLGVMDEARQILREYKDFTHWMHLPDLPSDFKRQTFEEYVAERLAFEAKVKQVRDASE